MIENFFCLDFIFYWKFYLVQIFTFTRYFHTTVNYLTFLLFAFSLRGPFPKEASKVHQILTTDFLSIKNFMNVTPEHCGRCSRHCSWLACWEYLEDLNLNFPLSSELCLKASFHKTGHFTFPFTLWLNKKFYIKCSHWFHTLDDLSLESSPISVAASSDIFFNHLSVESFVKCCLLA